MSNTYNEEQIKVLSDLEHVRLRKHLYIGDAIHPFHLFLEVMDNSVDEVQGGFGTEINIYIDTKENRYTIIDDGRGIPHGTKTVNNKQIEILKLLCTKLNSGAKFDSESYKISSGLHGQGLCCVNALSKYFTISSTRDGKKLEYDAIKDKLIESEADNSISGTEVVFIPDKKYFETDKIPTNLIINRCKTANAFGIKTNLYIDNELMDTSSNMEDLYPIEEDINTYVQYPLIYSTQNKNEERVAVFLKYTSDTKDKYYGYTNLLYNSVGGTHVNYISKLLCEVWKEYIDKSKIKLDVELKPTDVLVGLRCIVAVFISDPEFSSQTKEKLSVPRDYFNKFSEALKKQILSSLKFNDKQSRALVKRFEEYRISQNKLLSRKQISSLIKVNEDSPDNIRRRSVVTKLTECTSKNRKDTELYIVEGTSACGPAKRTRNKNLQAILELRGKILNVTGMTPKQAIKSQEVCNIVNSIGAGIGEQCNSKRSRYDRIYINCDGDEDGLHINCLVLSVFVNLLPDIIKDGRLYTVVPPLYGWEDEKGKKYYGNHIEEIPKGTKFTRFKGLGEMDDDEYYETCLNPKTRKVVQLEYPTNVDEFNRILGTAGGKADLLKNLGIIRDDRDWSNIEE